MTRTAHSRRRRSWVAYWVTSLGVVALGSCATLVYREIRLSNTLKFSHKGHLQEAECGDCHGGVEKTTGPTLGRFIGKGAHGGCAECHEVDQQCEKCHLSSDRRIRLTRRDRGLRFSHARHQRVEGGCKRCHGAAFEATVPGTIELAGHATCDTCHRAAREQLNCTFCHRDLTRQAIKPSGRLVHAGDFIKRHGQLAQDPARCASCHDQTFCADCHARTQAPGMTPPIRFPERVDAPFIHRGDFLARHAAEARAQPMTCQQCHGASHCSSCHELQGLSLPAATPQPRTTMRSVHGSDIMDPSAPGFHGRLARRDAARCAACHDQGAASNCVGCHKVGQMGGNPHPTGFRWRNKQGECSSNPMCGVCHVAGAGCASGP